MSVNPSSSRQPGNPKRSSSRGWNWFQSPTVLSWLEVVALTAWGALFLKYWLTQKLYLLIHPNYMLLTVVSGVLLLILGGIKASILWKQWLQQRQKKQGATPALQHLTLFPPGVSSILLLVTAILGFLITPRPFTSDTAMQRGITDALLNTRSQPQAFRSATRPEERSLIDWVRTLNVYPEPDAYTGQRVKVQGFVIHPPANEIPEQYLLISRFVLTCCAADAYPVGLPVKLSQPRATYPPDTWLEIQGQMITESFNGKRHLVIQAETLQPIPEPRNPYAY